jgi:hypothetical protein
MLRLSAFIFLLAFLSPAFAASMVEVKNLTFGSGCEQPVTKLKNAPANCPVANRQTRIWCPNGRVFDRNELPNVAESRSICELNQIQ